MKRVVYAFVVMYLLFSSGGRAMNTRDVILTFDPDKFVLTNCEGGTSIQSNYYDYIFLSNTNEPALPIIDYEFVINDNEKINTYEVEIGDEIAYDNIKMLPNPEILPTSIDSIPWNQGFFQYTKDSYPEKRVDFLGSYHIGNKTSLHFAISPFRYDSNTIKLYLAKEIRLKITISTNPKNDFSNRKQLFVGSERNPFLTSQDAEYIIITIDSLCSIYQELADWKTKKGVKTDVILLREIYNAYGGTLSNCQKIKSFIMDCYNNGNSPLKYVLFGGGNDSIPSYLTNIWFYRDSNLVNSTVFTDVYYASLKSVDWSPLNSPPYLGDGMYNDSVDISTDISVARIPFSQQEEVRRIVKRLLYYENYPKTANWNNNILLSGKQLSGSLPFLINGQIVSDSQCLSEKMFNKYIQPYWSGGSKRLFDTFSDITGVTGFTTSNINGELSKGYTFVNVDTHGSETFWTVDQGWYLTFDVPYFSNPNYSVITTTACHTNAFENSQCLSKSFLSADKGSVLGYWGSSREGFFSSNDSVHVSLSRQYIGEMYKKLLTSDYHRLGSAVHDAKEGLIGFTRFNTAPYRWLHLCMNLLGDPEMPVYTTLPNHFSSNSVQINVSGNQVSIFSGLSDCTYCKTVNTIDYSDFYTQKYYGGVSFPNRPGDQFNICITKPNYIPYQAICNNNVYLQSMTFYGDCHVLATNETSIGSNVTNIFPIGGVVVESGSTHINLANGVTIAGDFEVKQGAELIIE